MDLNRVKSEQIMKPTGTVTFLFADIVASGIDHQHSSSHASGPDRFGSIVNDIIARNHGLVYRTSGYRYCCAFVLPLDAIIAASQIQSRLGSGNGDREPVIFRMAIHSGEAKETDGNYCGPTVNRELHILSLARPGEVLLSNSVETLVAEFLPEDLQFLELPYSRESTRRDGILQLQRQSEKHCLTVPVPAPRPLGRHAGFKVAYSQPRSGVAYASRQGLRRRVRESVPVSVPAH